MREEASISLATLVSVGLTVGGIVLIALQIAGILPGGFAALGAVVSILGMLAFVTKYFNRRLDELEDRTACHEVEVYSHGVLDGTRLHLVSGTRNEGL